MNGSYFLYAEDDTDDTEIMKEAVLAQKKAYELVCVTDGFSLLQHLQQVGNGESYPCLIIMDLHLPKLSGIETLQLLRTDDIYRLIPVVVFSSKLSAKEKKVCEKLGAEVIRKPDTYTQWQDILLHLFSYADE